MWGRGQARKRGGLWREAIGDGKKRHGEGGVIIHFFCIYAKKYKTGGVGHHVKENEYKLKIIFKR